MTTYRELVYMCLDLIKGISDDFTYTEEHILYLLNKYRALVLKQRYEGAPKKDIPDSNKQTICLDLITVDSLEDFYRRSVIKVPKVLFNNVKISPLDYFKGNITFVSKERFKFVGHNKYLRSIIYATIQDDYVYLTSANEQFKYLDKVHITSIFENPFDAINKDLEESCGDILDAEMPIEDSLITTIIDLVVKELLGASYRPLDNTNNAADDAASMASFLARNMKSDFQKNLE